MGLVECQASPLDRPLENPTMLKMLIAVLSAVRKLCITLQQNPVGAGCLIVLASHGLIAFVLVLSRH
ncbi:hypothetical protein WI40_14765 [Burkholderia ubonensis]|nr:hypothetical protein WI40_14765 [Burkholderia ubonensis]